MPRIPAYHPEQRARLHPLQPSANPQAGRVAEQAADLMGEFARRLDEARIRRQISTAQNEAYDRLQGLRTQIQESGDWQSANETYETGAQKIRADLQKKYPNVADKVLPTFDHASIAGRYDIQRWSWGHEQAQSRADLYEDVKQNVARAVAAQTPEERQLYIDQIRHDTAAASGDFVTPLQSDRTRDTALSDIDQQRAEIAIEHDPAQALAMLKDDKQLTSLDPETRIALTHRAEAQLKVQQAAARSELQSRLSDDLASIAHTGQGVPGINEQMAAAGYTPEQIAEHRKRQAMAHTIYTTGQHILTMTVPEMQAQVAKLKPEPGAANYEAKYELWQKAEAQVGKTIEARKADPAGYAASVKPPTAQTAEGQIDQIYAQEDALGIPKDEQLPLPQATAKNVVAEWKAAAPDEKVSIMLGWQKDAGKHFHAVLKQFIQAGLPLSAAVMMHVSADVRDDMAQASGMSDAELNKASGNPSGLDDEVRGAMKPFLDTLPPNVHLKGQYLHMAVRMAQFYAARGDDHPAQEAVDNLFDGYYSYQGTLRIPKGRGYDPAKIANYGDFVLRNLDGHDLNDRGQPPLFFAERAYHEGHWITDTDGNSATLYVDHAPVTYRDGTAQAGKPVRLYFDHAAGFDYGAHAEPGKGHLANPESHGFIGGTPSPLAYKGAPLVPESHMKSDEQNSVSGMGNGQVNAGGKAPPPSPPGSALPWLRKLAQWTEPNSAAFQLLTRLIADAEGKKAKEKSK